jgi:hypothetical protein
MTISQHTDFEIYINQSTKDFLRTKIMNLLDYANCQELEEKCVMFLLESKELEQATKNTSGKNLEKTFPELF